MIDGAILPVTRIESDGFAQAVRSRILMLPASVQILCSRSFRMCDGVDFIIFEEFSCLRQIERSAFSNCDSLKAICFPTSLASIGERCVDFIETLESIQFQSGIRLSRIPKEAFRCCRLSIVSIPRSIEELGTRCFEDCRPLTVVAFETDSSLRRIGKAVFCGCSSLRSLCLPPSLELMDGGSLQESGVDEIEFEGDDPRFCRSGDFIVNGEGTALIACLDQSAAIVIPSTIESIGVRCFWRRCRVRTVAFANPCRIHRIEKKAFSECIFLASILVPASVEVICGYSFRSCRELVLVQFESGSRLRRIEKSAFLGTGLKSICIPCMVEFIDGSAFTASGIEADTIVLNNSHFRMVDHFLTDETETSLITFLYRGGSSESRSLCTPSSITTICKRAFFYCFFVHSVRFAPDSAILEIGKESLASSYIRSIVFPKSIEVLGKQCCRHCNGLARVVFERPSHLRRIESEAFHWCRSLKKFDVPASAEILCSRCFHECDFLVSIVFERGSRLRSIESNVFDDCRSLIFIAIPRCIELLSPDWLSGSSLRTVLCEGWDCGRRTIECGSLDKIENVRIQVKLKSGEVESEGMLVGDRIEVIRE
jgi:hypothetical protein